MHIAYLTETYPPDLNSDALTASRAVSHLRASGHTVQLIRPRRPGEPALDKGHEWRTAAWMPAAAFRARWHRGPSPDVVHAASSGPLAWSALRAAQNLGVPCSAACAIRPPDWWAGLWSKRVHRLADSNFASTAESAAALAQQGFERLRVVGRGVDIEQFSPAWRDPWLRRQWGADDDDRVLLCVGRLSNERNVALALRTFERLRRRRRGLRMVVVGDGPLRQTLQTRHPRALFAGVQRGSELARHYASADLLLYPGLEPSFGHVVLEAMASALVVVGFDGAAAQQHVVDGYSGCLAARAVGGAAASASFDAAVEQALARADPGGAMRRQARAAARLADWPGLLNNFEQRLVETAATPRIGALVEGVA